MFLKLCSYIGKRSDGGELSQWVSPSKETNGEADVKANRVVLFAHAGGLRGATVIDALDTLYIMELEEEFQEAKKWVEKSFDLNVVSQ